MFRLSIELGQSVERSPVHFQRSKDLTERLHVFKHVRFYSSVSIEHVRFYSSVSIASIAAGHYSCEAPEQWHIVVKLTLEIIGQYNNKLRIDLGQPFGRSPVPFSTRKRPNGRFYTNLSLLCFTVRSPRQASQRWHNSCCQAPEYCRSVVELTLKCTGRLKGSRCSLAGNWIIIINKFCLFIKRFYHRSLKSAY